MYESNIIYFIIIVSIHFNYVYTYKQFFYNLYFINLEIYLEDKMVHVLLMGLSNHFPITKIKAFIL